MKKIILIAILAAAFAVGFTFVAHIPESQIGDGDDTGLQYFQATLNGHSYIIARWEVNDGGWRYTMCPETK